MPSTAPTCSRLSRGAAPSFHLPLRSRTLRAPQPLGPGAGVGCQSLWLSTLAFPPAPESRVRGGRAAAAGGRRPEGTPGGEPPRAPWGCATGSAAQREARQPPGGGWGACHPRPPRRRPPRGWRARGSPWGLHGVPSVTLSCQTRAPLTAALETSLAPAGSGTPGRAPSSPCSRAALPWLEAVKTKPSRDGVRQKRERPISSLVFGPGYGGFVRPCQPRAKRHLPASALANLLFRGGCHFMSFCDRFCTLTFAFCCPAS